MEALNKLQIESLFSKGGTLDEKESEYLASVNFEKGKTLKNKIDFSISGKTYTYVLKSGIVASVSKLENGKTWYGYTMFDDWQERAIKKMLGVSTFSIFM